ncbi:hypothetical protein MBLNU457_4020t1 [Dothideomycetes sp. NU457]
MSTIPPARPYEPRRPPLPPRKPARSPLERAVTAPFNHAEHAANQAKKLANYRAWPLAGMMIAGAGIVAYSVMIGLSLTREPRTEDVPRTQAELTTVYDRTAGTFDSDVGYSEWAAGILKARQSIASSCKGDVLEVSAGTARNLGYYRFGPDGVKSLTLVDISREMVEQGKLKWKALHSQKGLQGVTQGVPVRFWQGDVKSSIPEPPQDETEGGVKEPKKQGYDTIYQSMGLCSTDEPVQLLQNIASHLDRSNPDAKIYLLEHGRGYYDWMNGILDKFAPQHAIKHGCWWNRDIGQIIRDSGLEVVTEKRMSFGTTWIYELKPGDEMKQLQQKEVTRNGEAEPTGLAAWLPRWTYEKICKR